MRKIGTEVMGKGKGMAKKAARPMAPPIGKKPMRPATPPVGPPALPSGGGMMGAAMSRKPRGKMY